MAIRPIILAPDKRLNQISRPVVLPDDLEALQDLMDTVRAHGNCRGLAAVQIGHMVRACVVNLENGTRQMFVNPEARSNDGFEVQTETCLSYPWLSPVKISRQASGLVTWSRIDGGEPTSAMFYGFDYRCVLHELDHMDGITIDTHRRKNDTQKRKRAG